jgi:hypothetical protein
VRRYKVSLRDKPEYRARLYPGAELAMEQELRRRRELRVNMQKTVADYYKVRVSDLLSKRRWTSHGNVIYLQRYLKDDGPSAA